MTIYATTVGAAIELIKGYDITHYPYLFNIRKKTYYNPEEKTTRWAFEDTEELLFYLNNFFKEKDCTNIKIQNHTNTDTESEPDYVNSPPHYTEGNIECFDAIESSMTKEAFKGFLKGNAIKYIWRYEKKGKPKEDLEKSIKVLNKLVSKLDE